MDVLRGEGWDLFLLEFAGTMHLFHTHFLLCGFESSGERDSIDLQEERPS